MSVFNSSNFLRRAIGRIEDMEAGVARDDELQLTSAKNYLNAKKDAIDRVMEIMRHLNHEHEVTFVVVTHDPLEALRLGDRIHVLMGRPARLGEPVSPRPQRPGR